MRAAFVFLQLGNTRCSASISTITQERSTARTRTTRPWPFHVSNILAKTLMAAIRGAGSPIQLNMRPNSVASDMIGMVVCFPEAAERVVENFIRCIPRLFCGKIGLIRPPGSVKGRERKLASAAMPLHQAGGRSCLCASMWLLPELCYASHPL